MSTSEDLVIRHRQPTDLTALGRVLVRVYEADGYPVEGVADPEAWLTPPREIAAWTAAFGGHPIGHISLTEAGPEDDAACLWAARTKADYSEAAVPVRLFVDPARRALGAGNQLMLAAHQHATSLGKRLVFDVMLKDQRAIRLYEALGCELLGTITHHHSDGLTEPAAVYLAPAYRA
jgi:GNAT superfamily N-acetyltransferase